ncbi:MAG: zinc ribbon domain-containing protein [Ruminiclostridium sp.]|nr:zinc ribbon domain-containing protein [Ruminiclostridium sp.]
MLCRNCSHPLPSGSAYCPYCGQKQVTRVSCPQCGAIIPEGAVFCMRCGTDITKKTSEERSFIMQPDSEGEPFYRKWTADHKQLAETKRITWISEFRGGYAVAIDDNAPGGELRPFLVRGENVAEIICYMSWTGANVSNGVLAQQGDCFRNGTRFISFILFRSNSMISSDEYKRVLLAFTGISMPYSTSGVALLISRGGRILYAGQYQENISGIADIFPLRVIGERYCLYTSPDEYNKMTNRERYSATTDNIKTAAQEIIDCDSGKVIMDNVFVPKYAGDPSEYFVEFFLYSERIIDVLHSSSGRDRCRCILNRRTGKIYHAGDNVRYKTLHVDGIRNRDRYLLLMISDIKQENALTGDTETGLFSVIDEFDNVIAELGRQSTLYSPEIIGTEDRLYLHADRSLNAGQNETSEIYSFDRSEDGSYVNAGKWRVSEGVRFADGLVHIHTADKTEANCGIFTVGGKTYIAILKEADDAGDGSDKCLIVDEKINKIFSFNYKLHYGSQTPYGVHVFDNDICALGSEEDDLGDTKAVLKNITTGETLFTADPAQLISNASAEFGASRIRPRYEFGSYRVGGNIFFLIGKQNRGLGIMDIHGNTVIPIDRENYFIVSAGAVGLIGEGTKYARLPADTFLVVLDSFDSNRYRVCGTDGVTVFEGSMNELAEHFS